MAVTLVNSGADTFGPDGGTIVINNGGASFLAYWVSAQAGATPSIHDDQGNNYIRVAAPNQASAGGNLWLFYAWDTVISGIIALTLTGSGTFAGIAWQGFTGVKTSSDPFVSIQGNGSDGGGSAITTGSISSTTGNLLTSGVTPFADTNDDTSIDSGFTRTAGIGFIPGGSYSVAGAYKVSTGSAENPEWSWPSGDQIFISAGIAEFEATGGGGGAVVKQLAALGVG